MIKIKNSKTKQKNKTCLFLLKNDIIIKKEEKKKMNEFIKSIFAGIMIGIACLISIGAGGGYVGAILFSVGLMIIVLRGYNLYTGKVGYVTSVKQLPLIGMFILGNLVGILLVSLCTNVSTMDIIQAKLSNPLPLVFAKAVGCGFLMYLAVDVYKTKNTLLGVFGCVPGFILAGFEHSIADMFYIVRGGIFTTEVVVFLLVVIIGNAVGAWLHKLI